MTHFTDDYRKRVNTIFHNVLNPVWFYSYEVFVVPGVLTGLFVSYDGISDDVTQIHDDCSWNEFLKRVTAIDPDWDCTPEFMKEVAATRPEFVMGGWLRRTPHIIKAGQHREQWSEESAIKDATALIMSTAKGTPVVIQNEIEHLREIVPPGPKYFKAFEHIVRVVFNFLFVGELGEGKAQSRTLSEEEGIEIRDLIFANKAEYGFWSDLKQKYSATEVVIDAKNTENLTRDDLRQLYCYLKPALGFWGFIVCRTQPSETVQAFNRTLFRNFNQTRGVLILTDDDLRRMVQLRIRGQNPSAYLQELMSKFVRSI